MVGREEPCRSNQLTEAQSLRCTIFIVSLRAWTHVMAVVSSSGGHALMRMPQTPDKDGYHYVTAHDGAQLRFRLLLGGPDGNHGINPKKRLAVCLHGLGDSMAWWEEAVFRLGELPSSYAPFSGDALPGVVAAPGAAEAQRPGGLRRRGKFVKALARRLNVALLDQRGFGGSGRPRSGPAPDARLTLVAAYEVADLAAFTEAIRTDLRSSAAARVETHCVSIAGSTAVVRMAHASVEAFARWAMHQALAGASHSQLQQYATLTEVAVMGPPSDLETVSLLPMPLTQGPQVRHYTQVVGSFMVDRMGRHLGDNEVTVTHRIDWHSYANPSTACDDLANDMHGGSSCLSFAISHSTKQVFVIGVLPDNQDVLDYTKRLQLWISSTESTISEIQLHAKSQVLKKLRAAPGVTQNAKLFQVFPLSFDNSNATTASATLDDFSSDVECILQYAGIPRATIVGHSMGAAVALRFAVDKADCVERLVTSGGAPRVGQAAQAKWASTAGQSMAWVPNVIRDTVSVVNIPDSDLNRMAAPALLVNAEDDQLTPVVGSQMLKAAMPNALLEVPKFGGHDVLVANDAAFERVVRFVMTEEALLFSDDPLFTEVLVSPWNLSGDKALMRYYQLGTALAGMEAAERRFRLVRNWARDDELRDEQCVYDPSDPRAAARLQEVAHRQRARMEKVMEEQEDVLAALDSVGLMPAHHDSNCMPREILLAEMQRLVGQMSAPSRSAVQQVGVWWRDPGRAAEGVADGKYTVDAWFRRRGGSRKHNCVWYRWDLSCVPPQLRTASAMQPVVEAVLSEMLQCWWCGGPLAGHEDLGPAASGEEPGFFPGVGLGRKPWRKFPAQREEQEEEEKSQQRTLELLPVIGGPTFQRMKLQP